MTNAGICMAHFHFHYYSQLWEERKVFFNIISAYNVHEFWMNTQGEGLCIWEYHKKYLVIQIKKYGI